MAHVLRPHRSLLKKRKPKVLEVVVGQTQPWRPWVMPVTWDMKGTEEWGSGNGGLCGKEWALEGMRNPVGLFRGLPDLWPSTPIPFLWASDSSSENGNYIFISGFLLELCRVKCKEQGSSCGKNWVLHRYSSQSRVSQPSWNHYLGLDHSLLWLDCYNTMAESYSCAS